MAGDFEQDAVKAMMRVSLGAGKLGVQFSAWLLRVAQSRKPLGKVSLKRLMKSSDKLVGEMLQSPDLKLLAQVMKEHRVAFTAMKHEGTDNYTLFFKARQQDQFELALQCFQSRLLELQKRREQGAKAKQKHPVRAAAPEQQTQQLEQPASKRFPQQVQGAPQNNRDTAKTRIADRLRDAGAKRQLYISQNTGKAIPRQQVRKIDLERGRG